MEVEFKNFKLKTAYNNLHVHRQQQCLELRSHDKALQSVIDLEHPHRLQLRNLEHLMGILLFIPAPRRILMLGTAAGSLLHFLRHHYPQAEIEAVDIDSELVERMLAMQVLPPAQTGLSYIYDDAAHYIEHCQPGFDLILVDVFSGAQSPAWLLERSCIEVLYRLLSDQGALGYNLLVDSEYDFKRFYRGLRQVFNETTLCLPVQDFANTIAYGFRYPVPPRDMNGHLQQALAFSETMDIDFVGLMSVIYNTNPSGRGVI